VQTGRFKTAREREGMIEPPPVDPDPHIRPHLVVPVFNWCSRHGLATGAGTTMMLSDRGARMCVAIGVAAPIASDLGKRIAENPDLLIDMADWLVGEAVRTIGTRDRLFSLSSQMDESLAELDALLESGGSAWTVDKDRPGLSLRVSSEELDAFSQATSVDDPITDYLREAWVAAWGLNPDGEKAHDRAIKALEATFRDVVAPGYPGAKLNDIANYLYDKPEKWTARLQDALPASVRKGRSDHGVEIVESIARGVFAADCRHAGIEGYTANDLDDGRDAVTLAAALIAMQRRGFLRRVDEGR